MELGAAVRSFTKWAALVALLAQVLAPLCPSPKSATYPLAPPSSSQLLWQRINPRPPPGSPSQVCASCNPVVWVRRITESIGLFQPHELRGEGLKYSKILAWFRRLYRFASSRTIRRLPWPSGDNDDEIGRRLYRMARVVMTSKGASAAN